VSKQDLHALKMRAGRGPFDEWFNGGNKAACAFHETESGTPFELWMGDDGEWRATCHSKCKRTWDAIQFLRERHKLSFGDAVKRLGGGPMQIEPRGSSDGKPAPTAMTADEWRNYGREVEQRDIDRLTASRKDRTASFETFRRLGCRMKDDDWMAFPYQRPESEQFYTVKLRHLDRKKFPQEHCVASNGMFNLAAVNELEDAYVVEGEMDVAIMAEDGFCAVGVVSGSQAKFDVEALKVLSRASRLFIMPDHGGRWRPDDPGEKCMDALQSALAKVQVEDTVYRLQLMDAKDACELASLFPDSFAARITEMSEESLKPWVTREIPRIHQLSKVPPRWLVDRMLPYEGLAEIAGTQGSAKSLLAMMIGRAVANGHFTLFQGLDPAEPPAVAGRELWTNVQTNWFEPVKGMAIKVSERPRTPVLYLDRENPEAEVNRRREQLGIIGGNDFIYWGAWNKNGEPPEPDDPRLLEWARREKGLIIFDSLQQWYGDANENDNTMMGELMRKFQRLARMCAGVLLLHHYRKEADAARGGTVITSIPDMTISLVKEHIGDIDVCKLGEIRFRISSKWTMEYHMRWVRNEDEKPSFGLMPTHWIQVSVKADDMEAEAIRKKDEHEEAVAAFIDKTLSEDPNLTMRAVVDKGREAFTDSRIFMGAGSSPLNKLKKRAADAGWSYDKDREPRWTKGEASKSDPHPMPF
jgi:hypothetical protein